MDLASEVIGVAKNSPSSKNRFIFYNNQLNYIPDSPLKILFSKAPILKGFLWNVFMEISRPSPKTFRDESLDSFITRRFGKNISGNIFSALVHGIYAGDTKQLSASSTFKILTDMEKRSGSIIIDLISNLFRRKKLDYDIEESSQDFIKFSTNLRETSSIYSFKNGMQTLSDTLELKLKENGVEIITDDCEDVKLDDSSVSIVLKNSKETVKVDHIFSGIPAFVLKDLIRNEQAFSEALSEIQAVNVGVVNLVYHNVILPVQGFGFLIPSQQDIHALGCVFDSCSFPAHRDDICILTVMLGGHLFEKQFGDVETVSESLLLDHATSIVEKVLGFSKKSLVDYRVQIQKQCIPQYTVGHSERVARIYNTKPSRLSLIGASYEGVSINDCIFNAKQKVDGFCNPKRST